MQVTTRTKPWTRLGMFLVVVGIVVPFGMAPHIRTFPSGPYRIIEERDGTDSVTRQIVYGHGQPLWQILADGSSQYYHEDPRGNVVALTEGVGSPTASAGDVLERYTYDPYGKPVFQDAANQDKRSRVGIPLAKSELQNTLLFRGRWYDAAPSARSASVNSDFGGLYLVEGRYYNPDTGRGTTRRILGGSVPALAAKTVHLDLEIDGDDDGEDANPYGWLASAPVNGCISPLCGGLFLANGLSPRDAASGLPTGKRQHKPFTLTKQIDKASGGATGTLAQRRRGGAVVEDMTVRKRPGRTTYANITLPQQTTGGSKTQFERDKIHVTIYPDGDSGGSSGQIGIGPVMPTGIEHEDIGVCDDCGGVDPVPVGIEHEDIGICPPDVCPPVNPIPVDFAVDESGFGLWSDAAPGEAGSTSSTIGIGATELCCGKTCSCPPPDCCGVSCSCQPPPLTEACRRRIPGNMSLPPMCR